MAGGYQNPAGGELKMRHRPTEKRVRGYTIIIPLNVPRIFPSNYIEQTAKILAEENEVILFDFRNPCPIFTFFRNASKRKKILHKISTLYRSRKNGIKEFSPLGIFPFQNNEYVYRLNRYLGVLQLKLILKFTRHNQLGVWGFHPLMALLVGKFNEKFSLYDCVDYYGEELRVGKELNRLEQRVFSRITLASFNSQALFEKKLATNPILKQKGFVAPCGCDVELFAKTKSKKDVLSHIPHPRIGFIGHVNYRFDFKLLKQLAVIRPNWSFVIVGPVFIRQPEDHRHNVLAGIEGLKQSANVFLLGKKRKRSLPQPLQAMDVCIVPYLVKFASVRYCNPMKAYEYLACGKPVVATNIPALRELRSELVAVTNDVNHFENAIEKFLSNWNDNKIEQAQNLARANSWEEKVAKIESMVTQAAYLPIS